MTSAHEESAVVTGPLRWLWLAIGWAAVVIGAIGIVVPGLPTTGFMVFAAWAFSKCSPRFEQWLLDLPGIGSMIQDYRSGLGMPKNAKISAVAMITIAVTTSSIIVDNGILRAVIIGTGFIGVYWVGIRIPTRPEHVDLVD